jgi:hypothetical protein
MSRITVKEVVSSDRSLLFRMAQDYKHRLEWDRFAHRIRYADGLITSQTAFASPAVLFNPFRMQVEHIRLCAPSMMATYMLKGPFFFSSMHWRWRFEKLNVVDKNAGIDVTGVEVQCIFKSRWPVLAFLLDPLLRCLLARDIRRVLNDLKYAAEKTDLIKRFV